MMYRFSPNRSELFGKGDDLEENMQALEEFIGPLRGNLKQVHDFYTLHNLHCLKKVWDAALVYKYLAHFIRTNGQTKHSN